MIQPEDTPSIAREDAPTKYSPAPWELIEATEHHGPYVVNSYGADVCDCYVMSDPSSLSTRNGGTSRPIAFADADANARLIAAAPELLDALREVVAIADRKTDAFDRAHAAIAKATGTEATTSEPAPTPRAPQAEHKKA